MQAQIKAIFIHFTQNVALTCKKRVLDNKCIACIFSSAFISPCSALFLAALRNRLPFTIPCSLFPPVLRLAVNNNLLQKSTTRVSYIDTYTQYEIRKPSIAFTNANEHTLFKKQLEKMNLHTYYMHKIYQTLI